MLKGSNGKITKLTIHWHEVRKTGDVFSGKFSAAFINRNCAIKRKTWIDIVSTDAVMVKFEDLTRNGKLPASVRKHFDKK